jgi:hypothetical protein
MIFIYLSYHILSYSILCILAEVMATAWPWHGHGMASASRVCCVYLSRVSGWGEARDPGRWLARTSAGAYDRNLEIPGDIWRHLEMEITEKRTQMNGNEWKWRLLPEYGLERLKYLIWRFGNQKTSLRALWNTPSHTPKHSKITTVHPSTEPSLILDVRWMQEVYDKFRRCSVWHPACGNTAL